MHARTGGRIVAGARSGRGRPGWGRRLRNRVQVKTPVDLGLIFSLAVSLLPINLTHDT